MLKSEVLRKRVGMEHAETYWTASDNAQLYTQTWYPADEPKSIIILIHGLGEHSSCYQDWAQQLAENTCQVVAYDMRGHGRSSGKRGHIARSRTLVNDLHAFTSSVVEENPDTPCFLYGHNLGATLAINMLAKEQLNLGGLICSAPWFCLTHEPSRFKQALIDMASSYLPFIKFRSPVLPRNLSDKLKIAHSFRNDPLYQYELSARFYKEIQMAGRTASISMYKINVPMLIMHGSNDAITACKASRNFVQNASAKTTYVEWEGAQHLLHADTHKDQVFKKLIDWLNQHCVR